MLRLQEIYDLAADEGWDVDRQGSVHFRLLAPGGQGVVLGPVTAGDQEAVRTLLTELKRRGLDAEQLHAERSGRSAGPSAAPSPVPAVSVTARTASNGRHAAEDERRKRMQEAGITMATRSTDGETATEKVARLRREAAEATARLQAEIEAAEREVALEEAAGSFDRVNAAVQDGRDGDLDDWVAVLGLAPDEAIRAAGFLVRGTGARSSASATAGTRAPRLAVEEVVAKLPSGPFTVADLAAAIDREVGTARNYVPKLLDAGAITEAGLDESAPGPRKPKLYTRA